MFRKLAYAWLGVAVVALGACSSEDSTDSSAARPETGSTTRRGGFILRTGGGEVLQNGILVKLSPANGTEGSILVQQTFPQGRSTILHRHEQGDELFYVVSGRGTAMLSGATDSIGPGDVVFVPRNEVHAIQNRGSADPLKVVFFMDSPELVEQFRAIHERIVSDPDNPPTADEFAKIEARYGGGVSVFPQDGGGSNDQ